MKPVARDQAFTVEGAAAFKGLPITVIRDAVNSGELGHCRHADFDPEYFNHGPGRKKGAVSIPKVDLEAWYLKFMTYYPSTAFNSAAVVNHGNLPSGNRIDIHV